MTSEMAAFGRRVAAAAVIIGLLFLLVYAIDVLLLVFAGILLAILLRTAGTWLSEHTRLSEKVSIAIVLITFGAVVFGSFAMFGIQIVNKADQLFFAVSEAYRQFHEKLAQYHIAGGLSPGGLNLESPVRAAASGAAWVVASMVMVLFIGVYLALQPRLYTELFLSFFEGASRRRVARLLDELGSALRWWLAGQLMAMAAVGAITTIGLLILGLPMAVPLGVIAALLTFVPYVGAIVSAVPALLIAMSHNGGMVMYVALIYLIAHVVEGYLIVPLIQHRFVYLPPAGILAWQFLMDVLVGVIGVTFGTPLLVVGMVLVKRLYFKQDWDEPSVEEAA